MTTEPAISVVIPVYNGEPFLGEAIQTVLGQTRPPAEVWVVDDGSNDGTSRVAQGFAGVRHLRLETNRGQAAALNLGVASASGSHLAFLDADDLWMPWKLERQMQALDSDPSLDVVYGLLQERILAVDRSTWSDGKVREAHLPSAMLIKRAAFEKVGGFDPRFTLGSVVDWYARACDAGLRQHMLRDIVYQRRIHGDNIGLRCTDRRTDYLEVVKTMLDRRRQAQGR